MAFTRNIPSYLKTPSKTRAQEAQELVSFRETITRLAAPIVKQRKEMFEDAVSRLAQVHKELDSLNVELADLGG